MFKHRLFLLLFFLPGVLFCKTNNKVNCLTSLEVDAERFAPQVFMQFAKPIYFERKVYKFLEKTKNKVNYRLELSFPAVSLNNFKQKEVVSKIKKLKGFVEDVELKYAKVPCPRVILNITLSDNILIRWSNLEYPNFLILDFFLKDELKKLKERGCSLEYAKNDIFKNRSMVAKNSLAGQKKKCCILVDAGHGGKDPGAKGFFLLKEKDIALDIARRTKKMLSSSGYNVFLTRNKDETLSLSERSSFASQLKADLFISIHVNASGNSSKASGVESYYLDGRSILPPRKRGGFLCVCNKSDACLAKHADKVFTKNINLSKYLATSIQGSILKFLKDKKAPAIDRGIKKQRFQVLLRSEIPVALIEVGFLTNKIEAKRLSVPGYRQLLARAITLGIKRYLSNKDKIA